MTEIEHEQGQSPEEVAIEEARSESPEQMKANILAFSREADILGSGLTEDRPPVEDDVDYGSPEVQRRLVEDGQRMLREAGHTSAKEAPSPEAVELYEAAAARELEDGGYEVEKGMQFAQRDKAGFLDFVRNALEQDEGLDELLEQFGANDVADLANSETFAALDPEEREAVWADIESHPVVSYADAVLSQGRADELAGKEHALRETQERASSLDAELWGRTVLGALGARGLTPDKLDGAMSEIEGFQQGLAQAGPEFLETLLGDDFDPASPADQLLYESLLVPLDERAGDDPDLPLEAQALGELVGRLGRAQASRSEQAKLLAAAGHRHLPLEDDAREAYLENWGGLPQRPVMSKKELLGILRAGPPPNRTGQQAARDLVKNSTNLRNRGELERVRNAHDAAHGKEMARRLAGLFPGR